jgi:hypothetical protein
MHAVWCSEAISWDLGQVAEPPMIPSTEAIYGGSRVEARNKPGVTALREIAAGEVGIEMLRKVPI